MRQNRSILDSVRGDVVALERGLGARDRVRLDEYLEHVREIEQRIQRAEKQATTEIDRARRRRSAFRTSFEEHAGVMFDLMALAYEADLTRVFTLHAEPRGEPAGVPEPRLQRAVAPRVASRQRAGEAGAAGRS